MPPFIAPQLTECLSRLPVVKSWASAKFQNNQSVVNLVVEKAMADCATYPVGGSLSRAGLVYMGVISPILIALFGILTGINACAKNQALLTSVRSRTGTPNCLGLTL